MQLWREEYEELRAEAQTLAPLVVDALALPPVDGDRAARIAQRRASLQQQMVLSPDAVDEVVAGVPCRVIRHPEQWAAFGNECELAVYPDGIHAFVGFPMALADRARDRIDQFLEGCLK
jgi:hypothetical protein